MLSLGEACRARHTAHRDMKRSIMRAPRSELGPLSGTISGTVSGHGPDVHDVAGADRVHAVGRLDQQPPDAVHVAGSTGEGTAAGQLDPDVAADGGARAQVLRAQPGASASPGSRPSAQRRYHCSSSRSMATEDVLPVRMSAAPSSHSDVAWLDGSSSWPALTLRPTPTTIASPACSARMPASLPAPLRRARGGQHVVGPLEADAHARSPPARPTPRRPRLAAEASPGGQAERGRPQQHGERQRRARLALPAAVEPAAARRLLLGDQDRSGRRACPRGSEQVGVG